MHKRAVRSTTSAAPATAATIAPAGLRAARRAALAALAAIAALVLAATTAGLVPAHSARAQARRTAAISKRLRLDAWHFALRQRGKPYIWGGTGPRGYDCSGLVWAAYRSIGIILPRTTFEMLASHALIRIRWRQARRGDLAFYGRGHVELFRYGYQTFGAAHTGTRIGYHRFNRFWHPTMYFRVR